MDIRAKHDSRDLEYRNPFGALKVGKTVVLRLEIHCDKVVDSCYLRFSYKNEGEEEYIPMKKIEAVSKIQLFEVVFSPREETGIYWYFFKFQIGEEVWFYGNNEEALGGEGILKREVPLGYQITLYKPATVPNWFKEGIMYQIYVDRFFNGNEDNMVLSPKKNSLIHGDWYDTPFYLKTPEGRIFRWDFFGGNFKGVIKKIPYLKELGVSIIYFNPIFESASNHKYDTGDYLKVDSMYGDLEIFEELVKKCEEEGIRIVLDGVFNHTGSSSLYFNKYGEYPSLGAYQSPDSPYYNWYKFKEGEGGYESWWGVDDLPEVDETNGEYQDFIYKGEDSVIRTWMKRGVKGWRLDVADELPEFFIKDLRKAIKKYDKDSVLIGEVWEDASNKVSYGTVRDYFNGYQLDSAMNYPFRTALVDYILYKETASTAANKLMSLYENYPRENFLGAMNILGSHDKERILTVLGGASASSFNKEEEKAEFLLGKVERDLAVKRLKLLSLIQLTFPGVPCIYYGDEAGLEGFFDPYNRKTYPWGRENIELLNWYKKLTYLRNSFDFWSHEDFKAFSIGEDIFAFKVESNEGELQVYVNRSGDRSYSIDLGEEGEILELLTGEILASSKYVLKPLKGGVFLRKEIKEEESFKRASGLLLPIFSLPGDFSLGDLGMPAFDFIDFLEEAGQKYWQVLPNNPVGKSNSPYYSPSVFANNPLYISLDKLKDLGLLGTWELLEEKAAFKERAGKKEGIDYDLVRKYKVPLFKKAYGKFISSLNKDNDEGFLSFKSFYAFIEDNIFWLKDYALFSYLLKNKGESWQEWSPLAFNHDFDFLNGILNENKYEIEYYYFLQYVYSWQWQELKAYANGKGIKIIGDLPIYVADNSGDVWSHREIFNLRTDGFPSIMAGVPPDYFSQTGQLWGNPTYNWKELEKHDYRWWVERVALALKEFDFIRLDHFRGFESFFGIEAGETTAAGGKWFKGPGMKLFKTLRERFGRLPFLAEDLGFITHEVNNLKNVLGFYGMEIFQFNHRERNLNKRVFYSGNHDTDTLAGWILTDRDMNKEELLATVRNIIVEMLATSAELTIFPVQDILGLDSRGRINVPGTMENNWSWALREGELTSDIAAWLKRQVEEKGRL